MEYKIEVSMMPNYDDSPNRPFFWCVLGRGADETKWCNFGHGWGKTSAEAWEQAYLYWNNITSDNWTDVF